MLKLLRAGYAALFKNKLFYIGTAAIVLFGALVAMMHLTDHLGYGIVYSVEDGFLVGVLMLFFVIPAFVALFVGTDHSDGTLRNKIIAGHSRIVIYLSHFVVCLTATLIMTLAYAVVSLAIEIPSSGAAGFINPMAGKFYAFSLLILTLMTGLCTMISMLCRNRAVTVMLTMGLAILIFVEGMYTYQSLNQPEFYDSVDLVDGEIVTEVVPNPNYPRGTWRKVLTFLNDFLPGGQLWSICTFEFEHMGRQALYTLGIFLLTGGLGIYFFRKEDLK